MGVTQIIQNQSIINLKTIKLLRMQHIRLVQSIKMEKWSEAARIQILTVFSFHPVKTITTAEGGVITTNNKNYYERLLALRIMV